jgi:hypothetical protein
MGGFRADTLPTGLVTDSLAPRELKGVFRDKRLSRWKERHSPCLIEITVLSGCLNVVHEACFQPALGTMVFASVAWLPPSPGRSLTASFSRPSQSAKTHQPWYLGAPPIDRFICNVSGPSNLVMIVAIATHHEPQGCREITSQPFKAARVSGDTRDMPGTYLTPLTWWRVGPQSLRPARMRMRVAREAGSGDFIWVVCLSRVSQHSLGSCSPGLVRFVR